MKILVQLLLATQLCLWNVTFAQEPFNSIVVGDPHADAPTIRTVDIGNGITLHFVDQGKGTPVIFVHGSLSDGGYWADQVGRFAEHYRAIAYSRRYNYPNSNLARSGYSAVVDAQDLAAFIHTLHLSKVVVIGHSYGALTALFLAFLGLITEELARLLPNHEIIVFPDAGHQMWYQAPDLCRKDVEAFLVRIGIQ
jgi:pimeloyl-ACP methyl ester carboxylesterase